jgi:hypothetical protein
MFVIMILINFVERTRHGEWLPISNVHVSSRSLRAHLAEKTVRAKPEELHISTR